MHYCNVKDTVAVKNWHNQEIIYGCRAQLQGTGSRIVKCQTMSNNVISCVEV